MNYERDEGMIHNNRAPEWDVVRMKSLSEITSMIEGAQSGNTSPLQEMIIAYEWKKAHYEICQCDVVPTELM